MRFTKSTGDFRAKVITGTCTVLMALDGAERARKGLLGFAFKRESLDGHQVGPKWLRSQKVFRSVVPDPKAERDPNDPQQPKRFSSWEHPIQSFLWSDYTAEPGRRYRFTIVPMYGRPGALEPRRGIEIEVETEKEFDQGHGVWFNRGAIASQAFAREFKNVGPEPRKNPDPTDARTKWLSRGLLEACLSFIDKTPAGGGLRVAAYEFTYAPFILALKSALLRGVDVRIVYHDTTEGGTRTGANERAIADAGMPERHNGKQVLFKRTKPKIPHNKFMVRLAGGTKPVAVWTGSTNFTPSGFLGQTNVGHALMADAATDEAAAAQIERTAEQFLEYWKLLKDDPDREAARARVMELTPHPPAVIRANSIARVFSPRPRSELLKWYGQRIDDAAGSVMFTAAFGVSKELVPPLVADRDFLRFILMEKPPTEQLGAEFKKDRDLVIAYGAVLGETWEFVDGEPRKRKRIQEFELDKWFLMEEHFRPKNEGHVFFVHTKFLLIDPLSNDPLICSGSANFSSNSLLENDENMLLIRGDTRVADIYMTEFDRIFRHFYFRDVANQIEQKGGEAKGAFLAEDDSWTDSYFKPGVLKTRRREMFFADPALTWVAKASVRPAAVPAERAKPAAAKKPAAKKPAAAKTPAGKKGKQPAAKKPAAKRKPKRGGR